MNVAIDFETFLELYDDELYAMYMETGCYYDTERELFDEQQYDEYCTRTGRWSNIT